VEKFLKERKRTKKKETKGRGGLWKLPQPRKSNKVACGNIFLGDFLRCLENPAGFSTVTTSPAAAINFNH
jgi:hypothetical protein